MSALEKEIVARVVEGRFAAPNVHAFRSAGMARLAH